MKPSTQEESMKIGNLTRRATTFGAAALIGLAAFGAAGTADAQGAKGKTVEYIAFGLQFEYQVALVNGIKKRAADAGVALHVIDGKGDPNLQVTEVLDAVTKKPDALLINPVDAKLLVAGVKRANEAKIPVFIMENPPPEGEYLSIVDFDNVAGGAMGADALGQAIGGKGVVLETRGSTGSQQAELRHKGFNDEIKAKFPDITVKSLNTEWVADNAYKMVLDALTQNPDVKGVFSHNDEMIRGVVSALRQTGKLVPAGDPAHITVVGLDGTPLALQRIREGTQDATVEQSPIAMGSFIFDQILNYFDGKPIEKKGETKPTLITKANVDDPEHWGNFKK
jgi:ribose transport system substrate-binding protein